MVPLPPPILTYVTDILSKAYKKCMYIRRDVCKAFALPNRLGIVALQNRPLPPWGKTSTTLSFITFSEVPDRRGSAYKPLATDQAHEGLM